MTNQLSGQPVLVLKEDMERMRGKDARKTNIAAARAIADSLRSTLGPKGMDKMLVDSLGDIVVTNDGATILKEMDVEHPAAKMMVEVAKTQDEEVGDGTTAAAIIAGELLTRAEELSDQEVHPTIIATGYRLAAEKANEILNDIATPISPDDTEILKKVALTAMTGKGAEGAKEHLAELVVKAVKAIATEEDGRIIIDRDNIKLEKKEGGGIVDTGLIQGIVFDKERVHPNMPKRIEKAKIALLNTSVEVEKTEVDTKVRITDPSQMKSFVDEEEKMLRDMVEWIKETGANVLICQKGIDDLAQHYLAKAGILAVRRAKKSDTEKLSKATGGSIVTNIEDLTEDDLGSAGVVEEFKIGDDEMTFVRDCKDPKAVTILIRGGTEHIVNEVERSLEDCLGVVPAAMRYAKIVAGGGASEVEVAKGLRAYAKTVGGREQLAIEAFAESMEAIPRALAENAGLDSIDVLVELRAGHEKGSVSHGLDVYGGRVMDMMEKGVVEPLRVKTQVIDSASEAAVMILRIDDVISASAKGEEAPPGAPPGIGGGGMPPMM